MRELVSLQQVTDHLRLDTTDPMVPFYISAASEAVLVYLNDSFVDSSGEVPQDSAGNPMGVPFPVMAATLLLVGEFYKNREGNEGNPVPAEFGYGYLNRAVVALLYPYRSPTLG